MGSTLRELLELALDSPRRALAEAWWWSSGGTLDSKELQDQATREVSGGDHDNCVSAIRRALASGAAENADLDALARALAPRPLAWLVALDRYAFEEVPALGDPPFIVRPRLALPNALAGGDSEFVVRRRQWPLNDEIAHARQPGHIQHWLRGHWISPVSVSGRAIRVRGMPPTHLRRGLSIAAAKTLRVAVVSLDDGASLEWQVQGNARLAVGVAGADARREALRAAVAAACDARVDVLVAPELTITEALRHDLVDRLLEFPNQPLWLITPGSFHESSSSAGRDAAKRNTARLLDADGRELARHDKLRPFAWQEDGVQHVEAIEAGHEVMLLETPIGHIAMAICLDQCEESAGFQTLWEWAAPDVLLAPAMDGATGLEPYGKAADRAARTHGCCSVVANQPPDSVAHGVTLRSLVRGRAGRLSPFVHEHINGCQIFVYDVVLGAAV